MSIENLRTLKNDLLLGLYRASTINALKATNRSIETSIDTVLSRDDVYQELHQELMRRLEGRVSK